MVVSNKVSFGKKGFKHLIGYKHDQKMHIYVYFSQKWVHTEETFLKLNEFLFLLKDEELLENIMKF